MALMNQKILVVGGGIAGCSAGIALAAAGHNVRIVEAQAGWRFQSSGIFVYCNGLACLADLGVLPKILATGYSVAQGRNAYYDHTGAEITQACYPTARDGQVPAIVGIKRAELHRVLAVRLDALGVSVQLGTTVGKMTEEAGAVDVTPSDGTHDTYDLVLGADGIRSSLRAKIGIELEPRSPGSASGARCIRGLRTLARRSL
jgi:2-polyprenyl-6-methoxyphenol hydroxylase-like FAD-dependent oxidoreductase